MRLPSLLLAAASLTLIASPLVAQPMPGGDMPPPGAPDGPPGGPGGKQGMRAVLDKLSPEGRRIVEQSFKDGMADREADQQTRKAARDKVRAAMTTEPFNASALRTAFEEERAIAQAHMKAHHERVVTQMAKLSAADRKVMAEALGSMESRFDKMRERWKERRGSN